MYIYIKECKEDYELVNKVDMPKVLKKIIIRLKKMFNIINIKQIDKYHYLYIIPKYNENKIKQIVKNNSNKTIIFSKELKKYSNNVNTKKYLVYYIYQILDYITTNMKVELELQNLYILTNEYTEKNISIINDIVKKVKTLTIITNNVKRYSLLEERLYNKEGILITVTNNKTKALKRANIIINLDFNNDDINMYKLNRQIIFINCCEDKINVPYLEGIMINDAEISAKRELDKSIIKNEKIYNILYNEFDKTEIYNTIEIFREKWYNSFTKIKEDKVHIKTLIGSRGIIQKEEFKNMQKLLTK